MRRYPPKEEGEESKGVLPRLILLSVTQETPKNCRGLRGVLPFGFSSRYFLRNSQTS